MNFYINSNKTDRAAVNIIKSDTIFAYGLIIATMTQISGSLADYSDSLCLIKDFPLRSRKPLSLLVIGKRYLGHAVLS